MIEYLLLFILGFSAAVLFALLVAPSIYGRIVKLTEKRMRSSVPLTTAEVRAEKDAARAAYAAENRKLSVELRQGQEKLYTVLAGQEKINKEIVARKAANEELARIIDELHVEAGDLRSELRREQDHVLRLQAALSASERASQAKSRQIENMMDKSRTLSSDLEGMRIDVATRETEAETLKAQIGLLRDERAKLRDEAKSERTKAREFELRSGRDDNRSASLDKKLSAAIADLSDREDKLARREAEIERLKQRLKAVEAQAAGMGLKPHSTPLDEEKPEPHAADEEPAQKERELMPPEIAARIDRIRGRHAALVDRISSASSGENDPALRDEMQEVAAMMVELTAAREGGHSPVGNLLGEDDGADAPAGLAARIRTVARDADGS